MQRLAVLHVPFHLRVGQLAIKLAAAVGEVVVAGYRHHCGWLVVGRDDITAGRILLLRVDAEGVKAGFVGLAAGAVEDERRVHTVRANRQFRRRPPADIATGIGPDEVQPRRLHLGSRFAHLAQGVGAIELVEAFEDRVLGFEERPPHGNRRGPCRGAEDFVDDWPVG
ncbi:hypothetical protein D3C76_878550 [compost metagenome]